MPTIIATACVQLPMRWIAHVVLMATCAFSTAVAARDGVTANEIFQHASHLASDELEGRRAGQVGAERAAHYITEQLKSFGYEPLGMSWELPFELRGGATEGFGRIGLGQTILTAPNLVQAPSYSPHAIVRAPITMDARANPSGKIVAMELEPGADDRQRAAELIARGAVGVVLLHPDSFVPPAAPAYQITFTSEQTVDELLAEADEVTRKQILESVRVDAPVITIASRLRDYVEQSAAQVGEITIDVRRLGRDYSTNVAGILVGADPVLRDEYVIVCGHYDHIGIAGGAIHYGADDNASGIAAVLEIAQAFATLERRPRRSVIIIAWGAEELNMVGSKAFCRNPPIDLARIAAVFNLDMVGRNDPATLQILAASEELRDACTSAATRHGFTQIEGDDVFLGASDTWPFVTRQIPAVMFHTGLHRDYNTPRDTVDRLDIDKIARVARTAFEAALEVANTDNRPEFSAIERNTQNE